MIFTRRAPTLHRAVAGRNLTGILIDDGDLLLRFTDAMMIVNLRDRTYKFQSILASWVTFPGWLRVARVIEDQNQIILEVAGGLFTARIVVRESRSEWRIILQGGRILASF